MAHSKLIIVCGLPGSGKTAHAKRLAERLHAIRLAPDEWMNDLAIDLRDESMRERWRGSSGSSVVNFSRSASQ